MTIVTMEAKRKRFEDMLLALKIQKGTMSQGIQGPLEDRKGQQIFAWSLHSSTALPTPYFSLVRPTLDFRHTER